MTEYAWVNTPGYKTDYAVAGKPLHAVPEGGHRSLCGLRKAKWSFDLFNVDRCRTCQRIMARMEEAAKAEVKE